MKCQVCGKESGKYPLCRACFAKKEKGEIIKCDKCNKWHFKDAPCTVSKVNEFLYQPKKSVITNIEYKFWLAIIEALPKDYIAFPQINLSIFIDRTDNSRFRNELFRNVDFLITDTNYAPKAVIEINDNTHMTSKRHERDEKVHNILEEAGIPIVTFWTNYGINPEYISKRLTEALSAPVKRVKHFNSNNNSEIPKESVPSTSSTAKETHVQNSSYNYSEPSYSSYSSSKKKGCYIATCVYGSYDCPEVWILRRFRDFTLSNNIFGRLFIKVYYAISPTLVKLFGKSKLFKRIMYIPINKLVMKLRLKGFDDSPYND